MAEHDPALYAQEDKGTRLWVTVMDQSREVAVAVLDAVAPAIREAALLEAARQSIDIAFGSNEDVRDWLTDMAAQQREEDTDGR